MAGTFSGPTARTYTYDAAGNIATNGASSTIGRTAYTYNARGRLVITATRTSSTATASVTHYHNALGQRVRKTGADGTVNFIYDEAGHLVGEFNGSNALIQETAWLGDTPIAMLTGTSTIQYIHADHLNTPRVITNTAGTMQWWWNADPFGHQGLNEDVDGNGTKVTYNPRFPGQYYDKTAATNYNYFRDYDPMTGRYLQSDPIGLAGGFNTYAYVGGNPLTNEDPFGLDQRICFFPSMTGHIGFGSASGATYGFYPYSNFDWRGQVAPDAPDRPRECKIVEATEEQDRCMEQCRMARENDPGRWHISKRQCTSFVRDCMKSCGLYRDNNPAWPDTTPYPRDFYDRLPAKPGRGHGR